VRKWLQRICICIFIIALGTLIYSLVSHRRVDVPDNAIREPRPQPPTYAYEPNDEYQPYEYYEPGYEYTPDTDEDSEGEGYIEDIPEPMVLSPRIVEFRELYNNPDIVGFIEITGTNISYPVVQTGNNVFYLYHDLHMRPSNAGAIFLDYENDLYQLADDNSIIYGHNMRNGSMFHNIRHFHRAEFFRQHTYILLDTPYRETVWDIFSFFHTTTDFCYLTTNFPTREQFYEFILLLQSMSAHSTDIVLSPEDQILILSTCGVHGGNNRYVVVARLRG